MFANDPCVLRTLDGRTITSGRVVRMDGDELVVDVQEEVDGRTIAPQEVHFKVTSTVRGECTYLAEIVAGQLNFLHVVLHQLLDAVQQRGAVREPVQLDYVIERWLPREEAPAGAPQERPGTDRDGAPAGTPGEGTPGEETPGEEASAGQPGARGPDATPVAELGPTAITVLDLSAQGMLFVGDVDVPVGTRFAFTFTHSRQPIELTAEIVRREANGTRPRYGCRFVDISERASDEIFRFILEQQRLRRRTGVVW